MLILELTFMLWLLQVCLRELYVLAKFITTWVAWWICETPLLYNSHTSHTCTRSTLSSGTDPEHVVKCKAWTQPCKRYTNTASFPPKWSHHESKKKKKNQLYAKKNIITLYVVSKSYAQFCAVVIGKSLVLENITILVFPVYMLMVLPFSWHLQREIIKLLSFCHFLLTTAKQISVLNSWIESFVTSHQNI